MKEIVMVCKKGREEGEVDIGGLRRKGGVKGRLGCEGEREVGVKGRGGLFLRSEEGE